MFCKNCGTQNPDGVKFCAGCGAPIEAPDAMPETQPLDPAFAPPTPQENYQAPPMAQPPYPAPQPPKKNNKNLIIGIVAGAVALMLIIVTALLIVFLGKDGSGTPDDQTTTETTTVQDVTEKNTEDATDKKEEPSTKDNLPVPPASEFVGKWYTYSAEEIAGMGTIETKLYLELKADGTYSMYFDEKELSNTYKTFFGNYIEKVAGEQGVSKDQMAQASGYDNYSQMLNDMSTSAVSAVSESLGGSLTISDGTWKITSSTQMLMVMNGLPVTEKYVLGVDKLTVTDPDGTVTEFER